MANTSLNTLIGRPRVHQGHQLNSDFPDLFQWPPAPFSGHPRRPGVASGGAIRMPRSSGLLSCRQLPGRTPAVNGSQKRPEFTCVFGHPQTSRRTWFFFATFFLHFEYTSLSCYLAVSLGRVSSHVGLRDCYLEKSCISNCKYIHSWCVFLSYLMKLKLIEATSKSLVQASVQSAIIWNCAKKLGTWTWTVLINHFLNISQASFQSWSSLFTSSSRTSRGRKSLSYSTLD